MSRFSGKCDIYDCYGDYTDEQIQNSQFYICGKGDRGHLLKIDNQKDLARYYPYLVAMSVGNKDGSVVYISSESFIDSEEKEFLQWRLNELKKYYRTQKRKKQAFDEKEAGKRIIWGDDEDNPLWELVKRVHELGEKADYNGVHLYMQEYYRKEWLECLIELGYDRDEALKIVYGWSRAWEKIQDEKRD